MVVRTKEGLIHRVASSPRWLDIPSIESNPAVAWALQHGFGTSFNLGREAHLDEQIELPWFHVFWNFPLGGVVL